MTEQYSVDWPKFVKGTMETAVYPTSFYDGIPYLALGLCGEVAEISEAFELEFGSFKFDPLTIGKRFESIKMECGDAFYYVAQMAHKSPWKIEAIECLSNQYISSRLAKVALDQLSRKAGRIAERVKKVIRLGARPIDSILDERSIAGCIYSLCDLCGYLRLNVQEVLDLNYQKLIGRKEKGTLALEMRNEESEC